MKEAHQIEKQSVMELECMRQKLKKYIRKYSERGSMQIKILYDRKETLSMYSDKEWMAFEIQFNSLFSEFIEKLCRSYPVMTENERRCCCLFLLDIKTGRIAEILGLAPNTISKYRKVIYDKYFNSDDEKTLEDRLFAMI